MAHLKMDLKFSSFQTTFLFLQNEGYSTNLCFQKYKKLYRKIKNNFKPQQFLAQSTLLTHNNLHQVAPLLKANEYM